MTNNLQWTIGDVTVTRIVESVAQIPPGGLLPSATAEVIESHASWLRPHFVDDDGNLVLSIHAFGVAVGDRRMIIDTCIGNDRQIPGMEALNLHTPFLADLAAAGFPREEVDTVICTHLHFDHVGWNTMLVDGEWVPTFPNARYVLCRDEWEHWSTEGGTGYAATLDDAVRPVVDAGLADLVAPDHRVTDEIRLELTPGHTPGHVAVHIESGGEHALVTGDLAHHPVQFAEPHWFADPDTDRAQSEATRRRLLEEYAGTDVLVIGTHFSRHRVAAVSSLTGTDSASRRLQPGMVDRNVPLSVLDLAPVGRGSSPAQALRNSIDLVQRVERLGYRRHWVAEHHNMPGIASSSPAVLLAHLASVTDTIRLGSGGVMLPNHSALTVAEQFGMLEALHPGRIDLGIGRAPGTDPLTAAALRRGPGMLGADDFPEQLAELLGYFDGSLPEGHRYERITAVPARGYRPAVWMLGSSTYGAHAAAVLGMPYSFAYHFAPAMLDDALAAYRSSFRPSPQLDTPYTMLGVSVVCGESDEHARWLAAPGALAFLRLRQGRPDVYPTPEEAAEYRFTPFERQQVEAWTVSHVIGGTESVRTRLESLVERTGVDELMVTTMVHAHDERVASYERLAGVFALSATR